MKNLMIANFHDSQKGQSIDAMRIHLRAQIENGLELGWNADDMIIICNFPFEHEGVTALETKLNEFCWTGSKMFAAHYVYHMNMTDDVIWAHDLDAWQNVWFDCPDFKDVGAACYSQPKFNGGSVFWRKSSKDIIDAILKTILKEQAVREEPTLNMTLKSKKYKNRVTSLNYSYNVGCSGYYERYTKSLKPIKVCHFHPRNRIAWETHALDRNGIGEKGISDRLENLIRRHYPGIAEELSDEGMLRRTEKIAARKAKEDA